MHTYLINHLRIPNGIPKPDSVRYLQRVEETFEPYGGRWLVLDAQVEVMEGAWPGAVVHLASRLPRRGLARLAVVVLARNQPRRRRASPTAAARAASVAIVTPSPMTTLGWR